MKSKEVDAYIAGQKPLQRKILKKIRALFLATLPGCEVKTGWGAIVIDRGKYYLAAMKTRVHVGFSIIGLSRKEVALLEGQGKTMRHIKIHSLEDIHKKKLAQLIRMVKRKARCGKCGARKA